MDIILKYWKSLDSFSTGLLVFSFITALVSLISAIIEFHDKRKKYWWGKPKSVKQFTIYLSFMITLLTLTFQIFKDANFNQQEIQKALRNDSIIKVQIDKLNITIKKQEETFESTQSILEKQIEELQNQGKIVRNGNKVLQNQDIQFQQMNKMSSQIDPVNNSSFFISFNVASIDTVKLMSNYYISRSCFQNDNLGRFEVKKDCINTFNQYNKFVESIYIYFIKKPVNKANIIKMLTSLSLRSKTYVNLPSIQNDFNGFLTNYNLISDESNIHFDEYGYFDVRLTYKPAFAPEYINTEFRELDKYLIIMIVGSKFKGFGVTSLYLINNKHDHSFRLNLNEIENRLVPVRLNDTSKMYRKIFVGDLLLHN